MRYIAIVVLLSVLPPMTRCHAGSKYPKEREWVQGYDDNSQWVERWGWLEPGGRIRYFPHEQATAPAKPRYPTGVKTDQLGDHQRVRGSDPAAVAAGNEILQKASEGHNHPVTAPCPGPNGPKPCPSQPQKPDAATHGIPVKVDYNIKPEYVAIGLLAVAIAYLFAGAKKQ